MADGFIPDTGVDPRTRRRLGVVLALRILAGWIVLALLYALLPPADAGTQTLVQLTVGVVLLAGLLALQTWSIVRHPHPNLRAAEALATGIPLFVLLFAWSYYSLSHVGPDNFTESLGRIDALYFAVTVVTTTGFGDITAVTEPARVVVMVQMVLGILAAGVIVRVILGAARMGAARRREERERGAAGGTGRPGAP